MADSQSARSRRERAPTRPANARRPDLQGLRAVAVLLVALDHANVPFLRGGYVGVDVFFVLSGYFITGVLLRDGFDRGDAGIGSISIRHFYARRARRILPAACMTLLATSIAVYVIYDLDRADLLATQSVLEDALASALFFANFHFAHTATNYFVQAAATLPSPVQHYWSLSVEEQIYVVWPTLLALIFFLSRRGRGSARAKRRRAAWLCGSVMGACFIGSLLYSIAYTHHDPQAAYFSTPARVYEFAIGALLALVGQRRIRLPGPLLAVLGSVGLAMIIFAALRYSATTSFPGAAALLPAVGTGLIILAGMVPLRSRRDAGSRPLLQSGIGGVLSVAPLRWVGDRSYAFYLWHYPVLILVWQASGHVLGWAENLGLLAGALALSAATFQLYENPLRFAAWLQQGWRTAAMAATAIGLALASILIPMSAYASTLNAQAAVARQTRSAMIAPAPGQPDPTSLGASTPVPAVAAAASAARRNQPLPRTLLPPLSALEADSYDTPAACAPTFGSGVTSQICKLGDPRSSRIVVMIGDSHSGMWDPAVINDARRHGFAVVPLAKSGCQLGDYDRNRPGWPCASWYAWARSEDRRLHPVATIVTFLWEQSYEHHPTHFVPRLKTFLDQMTHPILLADMPYQSQQPGVCVTSAGATRGRCSTPVPGSYVPFSKDVAAMTNADHVPVIPTLQWFCAQGTCPMVVADTLTVRDRSHLTMDYVNDLTTVFSLALNPILQRLEQGGDGLPPTTTLTKSG